MILLEDYYLNRRQTHQKMFNWKTTWPEDTWLEYDPPGRLPDRKITSPEEDLKDNLMERWLHWKTTSSKLKLPLSYSYSKPNPKANKTYAAQKHYIFQNLFLIQLLDAYSWLEPISQI